MCQWVYLSSGSLLLRICVGVRLALPLAIYSVLSFTSSSPLLSVDLGKDELFGRGC